MSKISPLGKISGYDELVSYYEENKHRPWQEWLSFDTAFDKPGKQGLVGLLKPTTGSARRYVFKISQYINYLAQHEGTVMQGLNALAPYCPHFCKSVGTITCQVDPRCRKEGNPFSIEAKYPIEKDVLLCEHINNSCKFYNYIRSERVAEEVLYSTTKQVLLAIAIAQRKKQFTHYDLHSFNVLMKKCNKDVVFMYVLDDENQYVVPTLGHYPVIIDFGFSYIQDMDDGPLWPSMSFTDTGFMSDRYDWVADPKLFLVSVSEEIKRKRDTKKARKLRRIVRNLFHPLGIDWQSGWDDGVEQGASEYINDLVHEHNPGSDLFENYDHYCVDLLTSLIILPLQPKDYSKIHVYYRIFVKEFMKIEQQISSPFYNLYILKNIVDAARYVHAGYLVNETRIDSIRVFRTKVSESIQSIANFCKMDHVHYERMLCSLLILARCSEGVLYDVMHTRMAEKEQEYEKLPLQSTEQIYAAIEINIPDEYTYSSNTTIFVFDGIRETTNMMQLTDDQAVIVNDIHPIARGTTLYDMYKEFSAHR